MTSKESLAIAEENQSLKRSLHLLIKRTEKDRELLQSFKTFELLLLSRTALAELLDLVINGLRDHFRLDAVTLVLFDPEQATRELLPDSLQEPALEFTESYSRVIHFYSEQAHFSGLQLRSGPLQPLLGPLKTCDREKAFDGHPGISSCAFLPLVRQQVVIGSLHLGSRDAQRFHQNSARDYLSHMASIISVCLENCINQERLRRLSHLDPLTKVYNRRFFDQEIQREIERTERSNQDLSCLFIDLDHFKSVNDTHGHAAGDQVLKTVAKTLREALRKTDFIARYGGEEFAVLLPNCGERQAERIAEKLRKEVADKAIEIDGGDRIQITLSAGVATLPPERDTTADKKSERLLEAADKAVYKAKESGRNRICKGKLKKTD